MCNRKKALLYGCGEVYKKNKQWIATLYNVIGVVDRKFEYSDAENGLYTIADGMMLSYDYILVTSVYIDEIKETLMKQYHVPEKKILYFLDEFSDERKISFGEKNPDITFLVLRAHYQEHANGFYNFFNRVVRTWHYAKKNNYELVVDMKNYYTEYATVEKYGQVNVWEWFYEQLSDYTLEDVYQSQNVILSQFGADWSEDRIGDVFYKEPEPYKPYVEMGKRYACFFHPSTKLKENINKEMDRLDNAGKKILGVLIRGTDFKRHPKNHPVMHDTEAVIKDIHAILCRDGYDAIYLATEDSDVLWELQQEFGNKLLYTEQQRTNRSDRLLMTIHFERENDAYLRGLEYCTVIEVLSRCQGLIVNCLCGGAMAALTINAGNYETLVVYDDGMY